MPALCPLLMALRAVCLTLTELEPLPPGLGWGLGLIGIHRPWLQLKSYSLKASSNEQPSLYIVSLHSWPLLLLPGIILMCFFCVHINCQFPRKLMGSLTAGPVSWWISHDDRHVAGLGERYMSFIQGYTQGQEITKCG